MFAIYSPDLNHSTVAEIRRHVNMQGKRGMLFRPFNPKDNGEAIAIWNLDRSRPVFLESTRKFNALFPRFNEGWKKSPDLRISRG